MSWAGFLRCRILSEYRKRKCGKLKVVPKPIFLDDGPFVLPFHDGIDNPLLCDVVTLGRHLEAQCLSLRIPDFRFPLEVSLRRVKFRVER
jgi:hypothetical protein